MDLERANDRAHALEAALTEMVRGASSATDVIVDLAAKENGILPGDRSNRDDFSFR